MLLNTILTAAILGCTLAAAKDSGRGRECGLPGQLACPKDMFCLRPPCPIGGKPCPGYCEFKNQYPSCGGFRPKPVKCPKGSTCHDDPRTPESCGMPCDAPGICIPDNAPSCLGFANLRCPRGLFCYENTFDGCDPEHGGADCPGICL